MATRHRDRPSVYMGLVEAFPLRPIRTDADLDRAIEVIDGLIDRDELNEDENDYLDVLSDIVRRYESERHPLPTVPESDMIRHLIEARGITQAKLARDTGIATSTISSILSGKRGLNRDHVASLAAYFKVSPAVFYGGEAGADDPAGAQRSISAGSPGRAIGSDPSHPAQQP